MATPASPFYGPTEPGAGFSTVAGSFDSPLSPIGFEETSTFDPANLLVDPTNTGDTGALQDVSTPFLPSVNNPETAGSDTLGAVISKGIDTAFSAWQLASQPKGTPRTVTTKVGPTTVVSGRPQGITGSLFGNVTPKEQSIINLIIVLVIGLIIYKLVVK